MKTPFTVDQFLDVFKSYNQAVYPMQVIFYGLGLIVIYMVIKPSVRSDRLISSILSFFWLWMGIVYHLIFFTAINKAAYLFGAMFIFQGILFLVHGVIQKKLSYRYRTDVYGIFGLVLVLFALFIYPFIGYLFGHTYPFSPTFGLPCPTTIFTFGILLFIDKRCPLSILIIPLIWSVIGFAAAINFGIKEDAGLPIAGPANIFHVVNPKQKVVEKGNLNYL